MDRSLLNVESLLEAGELDETELQEELRRLLGRELAPRGGELPRGRLRRIGLSLAGSLDEAVDRLIFFLAPDRRRAGESLVEALAEILWVPRLERTEYARNRLASPPWDIRRLLVEYAVWAGRLDDSLGALTKRFCAERCERLPVGCCTVLGYDMGLLPEAMLVAQELEARQGGWIAPAREEKCKYHGSGGCCLRLFKSPACAGMLCDDLIADLRARFDRVAIEAFLDPLARFRNRALDRAEIFELMRETVVAGQTLIEGEETG